ncbi:class I SAM-dependent methyltransferase [Stutzerimonas azotifigens]|uniref:Class I SAM-dependent methyltransferase n=1 Tax=Stutzerimonas azotifigens TaxID=291995 RepID=A0ABR5YWN0_9GAMM|nr:class I SAM-dependent methyltransferase [Stutzerimonas azotifigens]MBA1272349.1 class I SAM-dependent methyltransferase [Stutzerimonas azotifigens]
MATIEMRSIERRFLLEYYQSDASGWVDGHSLDAVRQCGGTSLWIGSYYALIEQLDYRPTVIVDLDAEALAVAHARFSSVPLVQADVRLLPFRNSFDTILMPGCVSAYLLDDRALYQATRSLARALKPTPTATLLVDAYDHRSIFDCHYFNGKRDVCLFGQRWRLEASCEPVSSEPCLFDVTLRFVCRDTPAQAPVQTTFCQRAYEPSELWQALTDEGLYCNEVRRNPRAGRFSLSFTPTPLRVDTLAESRGCYLSAF